MKQKHKKFLLNVDGKKYRADNLVALIVKYLKKDND